MFRVMMAACAVGLAASSPAAAAPTYPIDLRPDAAVRGTVLLVRAGGWQSPNRARIEQLRDDAERFVSLGWRAVALEYGEGRTGYADLRRAVARLAPRRRPFCLYGESAGGHLSLLLAGRAPERTRVDCVIAVSAPLDLASWENRAGSRPYFGEDPRWNPATYASRVRSGTLLVGARDDRIVAPQQNAAWVGAGGRARVVSLSPGSVSHVHGTVSAAELRRAHTAQRRLLRATETD